MSSIQSTVTVSLSDVLDSNKGLSTSEDSERSTWGHPEEIYVRVYPSATQLSPITYQEMSGSCVSYSQNLSEDIVDEVLSFSNSSSSDLSKRASGTVTILAVDLYYASYAMQTDPFTGNSVPSLVPTLTAVTNTDVSIVNNTKIIVSGGNCYGIVRVSYSTSYDLFKLTYPSSSGSTWGGAQSTLFLGSNPSTPFSAWSSTSSTSSYEACKPESHLCILFMSPTYGVALFTSSKILPFASNTYNFPADQPKRVKEFPIEVDSKHPLKLVGDYTAGVMKVEGVLVFYCPDFDGLTKTMTIGTISDFIAPSPPAGMAAEQVEGVCSIIEVLQYSNSSSSSLSYLPASPPTLTKLNTFVTDTSYSYSPSVIPPGETVATAEWLDKFSRYVDTKENKPVPRVTTEQEVVIAIGPRNIEAPGYGSVKAEYTTKFKKYLVSIPLPSGQDWFPSVTLTVYNEVYATSINLSMPARSGSKYPKMPSA